MLSDDWIFKLRFFLEVELDSRRDAHLLSEYVPLTVTIPVGGGLGLTRKL